VIDFRYHVVSLVAVLLALATGILLGSSVLSGPLYDRLEATTNRVVDERDELQAQVRDLQQELGFAATFADSVLPSLVSGRLAGEQVLIVTVPGVERDTVDGIVGVLDAAGATVTGELALSDAFANQEQESVLDNLVSRLQWAGLELPTDASTYERAAAELAAVVTTNDSTDAGEPPSSSQDQVLPGLQAAGFLSASEGAENNATRVVVITGPAPEERTDETRRADDAYLALARELDAGSSGAVVAGPRSASDGGLIDALRANDAGDVVSSVDVADTAYGRVAIVYALDAEADGRSGHYGIGGTTDGPLPTPTKESSD
jgi:uncharacterized protein YciI